jgi:zinc transport system ATP-binding protein
VTFSYDGTPVLDAVDLTIPERDLVCVIGPNGGGKTTLIKLMLGLIVPQRGRVTVLGGAPEDACRRIGYMPQHARLDPQFPVSVMDVVLMGRLGKGKVAGPYRRSDRAVAARVLEEVGLVDLRNRPLSALSGGERQRVLIARALACEPELLLFDEPTANLDPAIQDNLYALLSDLNERLTVVTVSHDVGFVSVFFKTAVCVDRHVHVHQTSELTSRQVADMYGREVRLVHHPPEVGAGVEP